MTQPIALTARAATPTDIPQLVAMQQAMAMESETLALNPERLARGVSRVVENPALGAYWLLVDGSAPDLVLAMALVTPEWSDWWDRPYWWLQSVYVLPGHRGQGLFGQLLAAVETAARAAEIPELRLYVAEGNAGAIGVYHKAGFAADHYRLMQKRLEPA